MRIMSDRPAREHHRSSKRKRLEESPPEFDKIFDLRDKPQLGSALLNQIMAECEQSRRNKAEDGDVEHSDLLFTLAHFVYGSPLAEADQKSDDACNAAFI